MADLTPSQTIGPFFADGLRWAVVATARTPTTADVTIEGRVLDADSKPVIDALIEVWQPAASAGALGGLQRVPTDAVGGFRFPVARSGSPARVTVFARGLLKAVCTRVHLPSAPVPPGVPSERVHTLVALPTPEASRFAWDIHLGGAEETVFFEM